MRVKRTSTNYHTLRTHKRREFMRNWFNETFMTNAKCIKCGNTNPIVIDFHHKDPKEKDGKVKNMLQKLLSKKIITAEVAKCDMLCANCHRILHWEENK
jgi:hypothetical protein